MDSHLIRYVIFLEDIPGQKASEDLIRSHVQFLRGLDRERKLDLCGPFLDRQGGMIILKVSSLEEAKEISEKDPFVRGGVKAYEVRRWALSCEENNHLGMG